jgi:thiol-disulfide isomerase/thioredoxin
MRFIVMCLFVFAVSGGVFAQDMKEPDMSTGSGAMMKADPKMKSNPRFAPSTGKKVIFTTLEAARKIAAKGPTVLFFAADWCPDCQAALKDINASGSRLKDVTVVVADYDKVPELKTRYGVTVQHTFVQIDTAGNKLAAWNGGGVDGILSHVTEKGM